MGEVVMLRGVGCILPENMEVPLLRDMSSCTKIAGVFDSIEDLHVLLKPLNCLQKVIRWGDRVAHHHMDEICMPQFVVDICAGHDGGRSGCETVYYFSTTLAA